LWKMVRRMVGVLAAVGAGELGPDDVALLLAEGRGEVPATLTAPSAGLFLECVCYEGETVPDTLAPAVMVR
jgi:tRNA U38,U39,U40 pseudouridine synthase TruA